MKTVIAFAIGYLIGNFATSVVLSKFTYNDDVRKHGSGNAGATNMLRVFGLGPATITFIGDSLKAILAVYLGRLIGGHEGSLYAGAAVVLGHNWPILLNFKGGKGIACSIGVLMFLNPALGIIALAIGVAVIFRFRYVSLGSIVGIVSAPILFLVAGENSGTVYLAAFLALLAIARHKDNILRLLDGSEKRVGEKTRVR